MTMEVHVALSSLDTRTREVITRLFGLDSGKPQSIENIAQELGETVGTVRRIRTLGLRTLRLFPERRMERVYVH